MNRKVLQMERNCNSSKHRRSALQACVWGSGEYGQLGLGDNRSRFDPVMLPGIKKDGAAGGMLEVEWHDIACGGFHTVAVTPTGDLYAWGLGASGRLGNGNNENEDKPKQVTILIGKEVVHVHCGTNHTAVVTSDGDLYTCGNGEKGRLGHGNHYNLSTFTKVEGLESQEVCQVACGGRHTIVLTSGGFVFTFGSNDFGQTGHGITEGTQSIPKKVTGCLESKKVIFVDANGNHSACITEDGDTYTWGKGANGQLGHGDKIDQSSPKLVDGLAGKKAKEVACGGHHTIVRTEDGQVYSFGCGEWGQLGHCSFEDELTPTLIQQAQLEGNRVVQVACGWFHSMALTSEGRLYTWGNGGHGRLGHGSELKSGVPSVVESLIGYEVVHISSQNEHSVVLVNSNASYSMKMKSMVDDETCSDVIFLLKDGERAHAMKGLLIGQSKYFRAMFRSGMKESIENQVEIRDCSKAVFLLFLEYLYSGEVDIGMDDAVELCALSDRYQEDGLSVRCLAVFQKGLRDANAIELLAEVDGLGLVGLKDVCMEYVISNYGRSFKKERLEVLSPSLMVEMLSKIAERHFE